MRKFVVWVAAAYIALGSFQAFAEVPDKLEPEYAEAILAFNARNFSQALQMLDALIKKAPDSVEFLELQAMAMKASNDPTRSAAAFQRLIEAKRKEGKLADTGPYQFELGTIRYREKKLKEAKTYLEASIQYGFNEGTAHLFLGIMSFNDGAWSDAEEHFQGVVSSKAEDIKHIGYFYLGQTYGKIGYSGGAAEAFAAARSRSKAMLDSRDATAENKAIAQKIFEATEKALVPFDHGSFFANIGLMSGYDSNLLAIPSSVNSDIETSRKGSPKETLMLGVGYATSPANTYLFVPSYRGNMNYLTNDQARGAEFYDHTASLIITRRPLARTNLGLKLEGTVVFKNNVGSPASRTAFDMFLFSKSASIGPFLKHELGRKFYLSLEASLQPQSFAQDGVGPEQRSGKDVMLRVLLQKDSGTRIWNPTLALHIDHNDTVGQDYRCDTQGFDVSDLLHLTDTTDVTGSFSWSHSNYDQRVDGKRKDSLLTARAIGTRKLSRLWSVVANADYTVNGSNYDDLFGYNRFTMGLGVTYTF